MSLVTDKVKRNIKHGFPFSSNGAILSDNVSNSAILYSISFHLNHMYVYIHTPKHIIYIWNKLAQKNSKYLENVIYEKERKKTLPFRAFSSCTNCGNR